MNRRSVWLIVLFAVTAMGADWPQWRGPNRDGISKETGLLKEWPKAGPKLLWKAEGLGREGNHALIKALERLAGVEVKG